MYAPTCIFDVVKAWSIWCKACVNDAKSCTKDTMAAVRASVDVQPLMGEGYEAYEIRCIFEDALKKALLL
ncbi:hypothetical protein DRO33_05600 [Candidatus Bathyarchaeota archaeon]|nr:MAG: hypothetical protein DRO33_05600 [Candidatus Bathyarchaeota archaeon]